MFKIISVLFLLLMSGSVTASTYLEKAAPYKSIILQELEHHFPDTPAYGYIPALISHETCPTVNSSKCWNPNVAFKTSREQGVGLGQLTRTYYKNGDIRFDTLEELRLKHKTELEELRWSNVKQRPDLQIRAMVLMVRSQYQKYLKVAATPIDALAFADSAYNGGGGHVDKDRILCRQAKGCNPGKWFGHVELYSVKSRAPLYAGRSAYTINRHHVKDVIQTKLPQFVSYGIPRAPVVESVVEPIEPTPSIPLTPQVVTRVPILGYLSSLDSDPTACSVVTSCTCYPTLNVGQELLVEHNPKPVYGWDEYQPPTHMTTKGWAPYDKTKYLDFDFQ